MSNRLTKLEHEMAGLEESFKRRAVDDLMQDPEVPIEHRPRGF